MGNATVFVSHAWTYPFADLLAALEARFGGDGTAPAAYLWLGALASSLRCALGPLKRCASRADVLVSSQHRTEALPQSWWSTAFATAIKDIGHTVLVLQPWHAPVPLTRSWCLWEIFNTLDAGVRLEVLMPPAQAEELHAALDTRFDAISATLSRIDTRRAEAEKPEDKVMIDAAVMASEGGFYAVNSRILESLREWLLQETREVAAALSTRHGATSADALAPRANLARLLGLLGHTAEAATLCGELAAAVITALGARSSHALAARGAHADAMAADGELQAALTLLRAVMRDREQLYAGQPEHAASQVAYARALVAYCACAARGLIEFRTPPQNLGAAVVWLFQAYWACLSASALNRHFYVPNEDPPRGYKWHELPLRLWIVVVLINVFGVATILIIFVPLNAADNYILAWRSLFYLPEAVKLCRAAHAVLAQTGPTLEALTCEALLGRALRDAGNLNEAEPLLSDAAQGLSALLGEMHMETMVVHTDLADLLRERDAPGDSVVAQIIFYRQAQRLEEQLGAGHPDALCARINYAVSVAWRGYRASARTMLQATEKLVRGGGKSPDSYGPARLQYIAMNALRGSEGWRLHVRWRTNARLNKHTEIFRTDVLRHLRARRRQRSLLGFTLLFVLAALISVTNTRTAFGNSVTTF